MKDLKTKERFIELRASGWSYDRISGELKTSRNTLINWARQLKVELANAKATAIDGLLGTYQAQREERIKFLAGEFSKARSELQARDLKDMSTDKVLDYTMKLLAALKSDSMGTVVFTGDSDFAMDCRESDYRHWDG